MSYYEDWWMKPRASIDFHQGVKMNKKVFFLKQDNSKKYLSEQEILSNKDQLIKTIQMHQTNSQYNQQQLFEEKQKERLKWTTPVPLLSNFQPKILETEFNKEMEQFNNINIPKFYNWEYQIPDQPVINVQNNSFDLQSQKIEFVFDTNEKTTLQQADFSLQRLFKPFTHTVLNELVEKQQSKSILKQTKTITENEMIFNDDEQTVLKMVLQILCIDVTDSSDFLVKVSNLLQKEPQNQSKFKKNIKMVHETIEKFHKFWLQLYNGKTVPLFPKWTLITGDEQTMENTTGLLTQNDMHKNLKKKTVPCVYYHSPQGCHWGDKCDFIHDPNYKGIPTPNMDKYVWPMAQMNTSQPNTSNFLRKEPPYKWINGKKVYITMNNSNEF